MTIPVTTCDIHIPIHQTNKYPLDLDSKLISQAIDNNTSQLLKIQTYENHIQQLMVNLDYLVKVVEEQSKQIGQLKEGVETESTVEDDKFLGQNQQVIDELKEQHDVLQKKYIASDTQKNEYFLQMQKYMLDFNDLQSKYDVDLGRKGRAYDELYNEFRMILQSGCSQDSSHHLIPESFTKTSNNDNYHYANAFDGTIDIDDEYIPSECSTLQHPPDSKTNGYKPPELLVELPTISEDNEDSDGDDENGGSHSHNKGTKEQGGYAKTVTDFRSDKETTEKSHNTMKTETHPNNSQSGASELNKQTQPSQSFQPLQSPQSQDKPIRFFDELHELPKILEYPLDGDTLAMWDSIKDFCEKKLSMREYCHIKLILWDYNAYIKEYIDLDAHHQNAQADLKRSQSMCTEAESRVKVLEDRVDEALAENLQQIALVSDYESKLLQAEERLNSLEKISNQKKNTLQRERTGEYDAETEAKGDNSDSDDSDVDGIDEDIETMKTMDALDDGYTTLISDNLTTIQKLRDSLVESSVRENDLLAENAALFDRIAKLELTKEVDHANNTMTQEKTESKKITYINDDYPDMYLRHYNTQTKSDDSEYYIRQTYFRELENILFSLYNTEKSEMPIQQIINHLHGKEHEYNKIVNQHNNEKNNVDGGLDVNLDTKENISMSSPSNASEDIVLSTLPTSTDKFTIADSMSSLHKIADIISAELQSLRKYKSQTTSTLSEMQGELNVKTTQHNTLYKNFTDTLNRSRQHEDTINAFQKDNVSLQNEILSTQERNKTLQLELQRENNEVSYYKEKSNELKTQLFLLVASYKTKSEQYLKLSKELRTVRRELRKRQQFVQNTNDEYAQIESFLSSLSQHILDSLFSLMQQVQQYSKYATRVRNDIKQQFEILLKESINNRDANVIGNDDNHEHISTVIQDHVDRINRKFGEESTSLSNFFTTMTTQMKTLSASVTLESNPSLLTPTNSQ